MVRVLIAILAGSLAACSVNIKMPVNRFDSPETIGQPGVIKSEIGMQGTAEIVLAEDPQSNTQPNTTNPTINGDSRVRVAAAYSAFDALDIEYRPPFGASFKFQLIGTSYKSAKAGNFSAAISFGGKYAMNQYPDPLSRDTIQMKLNETMFDAALIAGYRVADMFMVYGGPFITTDSFSGTWHDSVNIDSTAKLTGLNLGIEISATSFQGRLEYALGKASSMESSKTIGSLGASIGYLF